LDKVQKVSKPTVRTRRLSAAQYVDGIFGGERTVLARAITLIESDLPSDQDLASEVIERCLPRSGQSRRIGVTGVPGSGKSTLIEALGTYLTEERGETVAVLAIDPSSPISRGSILGDKTRMERLATSDLAFIRPSPSRGHLGGVAHRTREALILCEAAGYRNTFVETVGVGQSESAVRSMVDTLLLLVLAGAGDDLQFMKRGILEMIDAIAINKADGDNRVLAERTRRDYETAMHLWPLSEAGWQPPVLACSASNREGIDALWKHLLDHRNHIERNGWLARMRSEQAMEWMRDALLLGIEEEFRREAVDGGRLAAMQRNVLEGKLSPFRAARQLLGRFRSGA
jgi:LAO/AO transport system kinase